MARWNPTQGRKGGFGGYYFEYEYNTTRPANQAIGDKEKAAIPIKATPHIFFILFNVFIPCIQI